MNVVIKFCCAAAISVFILPVPTVLAEPAGLTRACEKLYDKYFASDSPKAFAKGRSKGCGWKGPGGNISVAEARKRANAYCVADGGDGCVVVESVR